MNTFSTTIISKFSVAMLLLLSMAFLGVGFYTQAPEADAQGATINLCINRSNGELRKPSVDGECPPGNDTISGISTTHNGVCVAQEEDTRRWGLVLPEGEYKLDAGGKNCLLVSNSSVIGPFVRFNTIPTYSPGVNTNNGNGNSGNSNGNGNSGNGNGNTGSGNSGNGNSGTGNGNSGGGTQVRGDCEEKFHKVGPLCVPDSPFTNKDALINSTSGSGLAVRIIRILLYFAGIVAVIMAIIGGYYIMTARGNETQAADGRKTLTNAIIGLAIVILSYIIIQAVISFLTK